MLVLRHLNQGTYNPPRNLTSLVVTTHPAPLTPDPMLEGPRIPIASCGTANTFFLINIGFGGGGAGVPPPATLEMIGRGRTDEKKQKLSTVSASLPMTCWGVFCLCSPRLRTVVYKNGSVKIIMITRPLLHEFDRDQDCFVVPRCGARGS